MGKRRRLRRPRFLIATPPWEAKMAKIANVRSASWTTGMVELKAFPNSPLQARIALRDRTAKENGSTKKSSRPHARAEISIGTNLPAKMRR
ncbi:MAG: hypothetical protein HY555_01565 [Euryarchaeota archaeon]|nr:hypothetical protein [Euryarchaeota archaeon]